MRLWVAVAIVLSLLAASAAEAQSRLALLIGNQSYDPSVGVLKNPYNDIAVVGDALAKQGFEVLPPIKDAKRSGILGGVRDLVRRLNAAGTGAIGFIYYSGHGAAEKDTNINYLIPVDAKEPGSTAFWDESLKLDDILRLLDGARSAAKFIVFDACRNELQIPTKDTSKGLLPVAEQQGMFIAYASAPGRTASDRGDRSGPYAAALAAELTRPGLDHLNLFQNVKEAVLSSTGGAQQPWESNGIGRRVYLTGLPQATEPPNAASSTTPQSPKISEAERAWTLVKDTTVVSALDAYIRRFGDTFYGDLAKARLTDLKRQAAAAPLAPAGKGDERFLNGSHPFDGTRVANIHSNTAHELGIEEQEGVAVLSVRAGSTAAQLGFRRGDIIAQVGDEKIETVNKLEDLLNKLGVLNEHPRIWRVVVKRGKQVMQVKFSG